MTRKTLSSLLVLLCMTMPAHAKEKEAQTDMVVAVVNGNEIKLSEVKAVQAANAQLSALPIQSIYQPLLDSLIDFTVVSDVAYKEKLNKTPEFQNQLKRAEKQLLANFYLEKQIKKAQTKEALEQMYNEFVKDNPPQEEMSAAHILLKTEKEAEKVIKQIQKGADFAKLANEISENKGLQDGDLGFFTKELMVPEFSEAAFEMKEGEISKTPVKTKFGYHIIKAGPRRLAETPALEEIKAELERSQATKTAEKTMSDLRKKAEITKTPVDFTPAGKIIKK